MLHKYFYPYLVLQVKFINYDFYLRDTPFILVSYVNPLNPGNVPNSLNIGNSISSLLPEFICNSCKFALWKENKFFSTKKKTLTKDIAKMLLNTGSVLVSGFVSEKTGKSYNAIISLEDKKDGYLSFKMELKKTIKVTCFSQNLNELH